MDIVTDLSSYDFSDNPALAGLNNLGAYNLNQGVDALLDVMREVADSGAYYTLIVPSPPAGLIAIDALQQFTGVVQVPVGSVLLAITGQAIAVSEQRGGGNSTGSFSVKVFDKATGVDLFNGQWEFGSLVAPSLTQLSNGSLQQYGQDGPIGPWYLANPFIVISPNSIEVTVQNFDSNVQLIQVALHFAVPCSGSDVVAE